MACAQLIGWAGPNAQRFNHSSSTSACSGAHWNYSYHVHMALVTVSTRTNMKSVCDCDKSTWTMYLNLTVRSDQLTFGYSPLQQFVIVCIEDGFIMENGNIFGHRLAVSSSISEGNMLLASSDGASSFVRNPPATSLRRNSCLFWMTFSHLWPSI